MESLEYKLGKFDGMLEIFAQLNTYTNHQFSFYIIPLNHQLPLQIAVDEHFAKFDENAVITFEEMENWKVNVRELLTNWLFGFSKHSDLKDLNFADKDYRYLCIYKFIKDLSENYQIHSVFHLVIKMKSFYENWWDDIVLVGENGTLLIHLGVSD